MRDSGYIVIGMLSRNTHNSIRFARPHHQCPMSGVTFKYGSLNHK
jgi:hypothetical protein